MGLKFLLGIMACISIAVFADFPDQRQEIEKINLCEENSNHQMQQLRQNYIKISNDIRNIAGILDFTMNILPSHIAAKLSDTSKKDETCSKILTLEKQLELIKEENKELSSTSNLQSISNKQLEQCEDRSRKISDNLVAKCDSEKSELQTLKLSLEGEIKKLSTELKNNTQLVTKLRTNLQLAKEKSADSACNFYSYITLDKLGNHSYYFEGVRFLNWTQARDFCEANNMKLLSIDDEEERHQLYYFCASKYGFVNWKTFWTSGRFDPDEGRWKWTANNQTINLAKDFTALANVPDTYIVVGYNTGSKLYSGYNPSSFKMNFICKVTPECEDKV